MRSADGVLILMMYRIIGTNYPHLTTPYVFHICIPMTEGNIPQQAYFCAWKDGCQVQIWLLVRYKPIANSVGFQSESGFIYYKCRISLPAVHSLWSRSYHHVSYDWLHEWKRFSFSWCLLQHVFLDNLFTFHLCLIHSPLFDTLTPVESTAITKLSPCKPELSLLSEIVISSRFILLLMLQ
jgi:hypothetical protein